MDLQLDLGTYASDWIQYYNKALSVTSGTIEVASRDNEILGTIQEKLQAFTLGLTNGLIDNAEYAGSTAIAKGVDSWC